MQGALKVLGTRTVPVDAKSKSNGEFEVEAVYNQLALLGRLGVCSSRNR